MKPAAATIAFLAVASAALAQENAAKWPRALELENATVVVYQPQLEKLSGVTLSGRAAFSWEAEGAAPVFGVFGSTRGSSGCRMPILRRNKR